MLIRANVWELGGDWGAPILWYARAVKALKARPIADTSSWRFFGAIHGLDQGLWHKFGYWSPGEKKPNADAMARFWKQCQHGSWYFLPWHRGYVLGFEETVRAAVVSLGGPSDWALPYWNYFKGNQNALPPAFASPNWPDGHGDNPLHVPQRWGPNNDGKVFVPLDQINLNAMSDPDFTGVDSGGSPGFGGVDTGFSHGGSVHGLLETEPHDWVHGLVGGADPSTGGQLPGLMSDPDTAGLDPIFWLHHANIDRLWAVWRQNPPTDANPADARWLRGPASSGAREFVVPRPAGAWTYTPADVVDLAPLGYTYDDLSPALPAATLADRLQRLRAAPAPATAMSTPRPPQKKTELVGASGAVKLSGDTETRASLRLDEGARRKVAASLRSASAAAPPDRVFLNLENVRGASDASAFYVYVGPKGGNGEKAGSIAPFGVRKASLPGGEHGGAGLTFVLDITRIVDKLHLAGGFDIDALDVRLVPVKPIPDVAEISIGRISVFRQGAG